MVTRYRQSLREALRHRRQARLPDIAPVLLTVLAGTLAYIALATVALPADKPREYHFVEEGGAITALSAVFLAMACAFSLASLVARVRLEQSPLWPWAAMAPAFAFLALDELLQFHERFGSLIERQLSSGIFKNWNDLIVFSYGVITAVFIAAALPALLRCRMVMELFAAAFLF